MIRSRGISEKIVYVHNPLPDVTEAQLLEDAELDDVLEPSQCKPFEITWKYGTGNEQETIQVGPGEFFALRESEAREFMDGSNFSDLGLCVLESTDLTKAANKRLVSAALKRAAQFYYNVGTKQLVKQRKTHNYNADDMHDMRGQLHAYYINQAKEAAIRALISPTKRPTKAAA